MRGIWNSWFDQVFPPTPEESEADDDEEQESTQEISNDRDKKKGSGHLRKTQTSK